jgi:hypothetical protein
VKIRDNPKIGPNKIDANNENKNPILRLDPIKYAIKNPKTKSIIRIIIHGLVIWLKLLFRVQNIQ